MVGFKIPIPTMAADDHQGSRNFLARAGWRQFPRTTLASAVADSAMVPGKSICSPTFQTEPAESRYQSNTSAIFCEQPRDDRIRAEPQMTAVLLVGADGKDRPFAS